MGLSPGDCGGIPGFYKMIEARAYPSHFDHAKNNEWLERYNSDELDASLIQAYLSRIAARRSAPAKRIIKPTND